MDKNITIGNMLGFMFIRLIVNFNTIKFKIIIS